MASSSSNATSSTPASSATNTVPPETDDPARIAADISRGEDREDAEHPQSSRESEGEGVAANGPMANTSARRHDGDENGGPSDEERDNDENSAIGSQVRRGPPTAAGEFVLTAVPLDTWVGRYVRITTPRHNGTTGKVHRTGNGWVNLQTAQGEVAKRAYDLVVIPAHQARITNGDGGTTERTDSRGRRFNRGTGARGPSSMGSTSGSGDDKKSAARARNARTAAAAARSSSDSSDPEDMNDEGHDQESSRPTRRTMRAASDAESDLEDVDDADNDDDDGEENDNNHYHDDNKLKAAGKGKQPNRSARGVSKGMLKMKNEKIASGDMGRDSARFAGRSFGKSSTRDGGGEKSKSRSRPHDNERSRDRDRGRERNDLQRVGGSRERDSLKADNHATVARDDHRGRDRDGDTGTSRSKRKEATAALAALADGDDKAVSVSTAKDRLDRSNTKAQAASTMKKEDIKPSWVTQMAKAKERPNLVQWREELESICKDSSEDLEDVSLSVELMKIRCDVCYHEKADGDKFCWNEKCWLSPIFFAYFKTNSDDARDDESIPSAPRSGYINTFGRETIIDPAVTSTLQAPVKWIETKRRRVESHEIFSEDPALYRWQCWASNFKDPTSKDPTYNSVAKSRPDGKRQKTSTAASKLVPDSTRSSRALGEGDSYKNGNGDAAGSDDHTGKANVKSSVKAEPSQGLGNFYRTESVDAMDVPPSSLPGRGSSLSGNRCNNDDFIARKASPTYSVGNESRMTMYPDDDRANLDGRRDNDVIPMQDGDDEAGVSRRVEGGNSDRRWS